MEQFRLRVRNEPKRGQIWELHLFPNQPHRRFREADGRILGSSSAPEATYWLRQAADPYLLRAEAPTPIAASEFGPGSEPRWLQHEDGMRMALAFSAGRWLITKKQRRMFLEGLKNLPSEVVLYWFTLCFYGYQQAAGRAALRTLLTHQEPDETVRIDDLSPTLQEKSATHRTYVIPGPDREARLQQAHEALGEYSARSRKQVEQEISRDESALDFERGPQPKARSKRGRRSKS
jgi:hypothetical protein